MRAFSRSLDTATKPMEAVSLHSLASGSSDLCFWSLKLGSLAVEVA
jgi:hypothetical protein